MAKKKVLFGSKDSWDQDKIIEIWKAVKQIAEEDMHLIEGQDYYEPSFVLVSYQQMLENNTTIGMPFGYSHWSFGQNAVIEESNYKNGRSGLTYEMVINSDPSLCYLMDTNTITMQTLTIAHAAIGHSAVFKNNIYFANHTDAKNIIGYLKFAQNYINECEEKYGEDEVDALIDAAHAVRYFSVDRFQRNKKKKDLDTAMQPCDLLYDTIIGKPHQEVKKVKEEYATIKHKKTFDPEENILYFIEKNADLPVWKKEVLRIIRKVSQYFWPQRQTNVVHEGAASFTHWYIMNRLYDKGLIDDGSMMEFIATHSNVLYQTPLAQFNPYNLGFHIFKDIYDKAIRDGRSWQDDFKQAITYYNNESFLLQYVTPDVAADMKMFGLELNREEGVAVVTEVVSDQYDDNMFRNLRQRLAKEYSPSHNDPNIQVVAVDYDNDNTLYLQQFSDVNDKRLLSSESMMYVLDALTYLWGGPVRLVDPLIDDGDILIEDDIEEQDVAMRQLREKPYIMAF